MKCLFVPVAILAVTLINIVAHAEVEPMENVIVDQVASPVSYADLKKAGAGYICTKKTSAISHRARKVKGTKEIYSTSKQTESTTDSDQYYDCRFKVYEKSTRKWVNQ
jgi:hypothetical protein